MVINADIHKFVCILKATILNTTKYYSIAKSFDRKNRSKNVNETTPIQDLVLIYFSGVSCS